MTCGISDPEEDASTGPDWLDEGDLVQRGLSRRLIAELPVHRTGLDGRPCWHRDEINDLVTEVRRRNRR